MNDPTDILREYEQWRLDTVDRHMEEPDLSVAAFTLERDREYDAQRIQEAMATLEVVKARYGGYHSTNEEAATLLNYIAAIHYTLTEGPGSLATQQRMVVS